MTLVQKIEQAYLDAAKARDMETIAIVRLLKSALKNEAIKISDLHYVLSDDEAIAVLNKEAKQRRDSIEQYEAAGRADLAEQEKKELAYIETYLPKALSDEELASVVDKVLADTGATQKADMGKVMGALKAELSNPADISRGAALMSSKLS